MDAGLSSINADESGDICVLRIAGTLPAQARPAPLQVVAAKHDRDVKVHGYPDNLPEGVWASAITQGRTGPGGEWVQLRGQTLLGQPITGGFSGAGVLDERTNAVIGMVIRERVDAMAQTAFMMSLEMIAEYWPRLDDLLTTSVRNDPQTRNWQAALAEAGRENQALRERLEEVEASLKTALEKLEKRKSLKEHEKARVTLVQQFRSLTWTGIRVSLSAVIMRMMWTQSRISRRAWNT